MEKKLADILEHGGLYPDIQGDNHREVLASFVNSIPPVNSTETLAADKLLKVVLEREELMSTSIGKGIALPHPRIPLITSPDDEFVALAYLKNPVDWNSLDGEKVDTLFLIISADAKHHLEVLSKINYFCRQENFYRKLKERANLGEIVRFIREAEKNWK